MPHSPLPQSGPPVGSQAGPSLPVPGPIPLLTCRRNGFLTCCLASRDAPSRLPQPSALPQRHRDARSSSAGTQLQSNEHLLCRQTSVLLCARRRTPAPPSPPPAPRVPSPSPTCRSPAVGPVPTLSAVFSRAREGRGPRTLRVSQQLH